MIDAIYAQWLDLFPGDLREQAELLPTLLGWHVVLTLAALATGTLISIPLGVIASRSRSFSLASTTGAGVIQTIPSLALLAVMVPAFAWGLPKLAPLFTDANPDDLKRYALGFWPAYVALTLYSILPTLRNTIAGIHGVDPAAVEAARGLGMSPMQVLTRVELPLALPVIVAGIRTATVWVVGIATLATPVGALCLGGYIFGGLQTRRFDVVLLGSIAAAVLAIVLDQLIHLFETASRRRSAGLGWTATVLSIVFVAGAMFVPVRDTLDDYLNPPMVVGGKTFTEQFILAELMQGMLISEDIKAATRTNLGSTVLYDGLRTGAVDVYVDYSGTIWATIMKREEAADPDTIVEQVGQYVDEADGVLSLGSLGFENTYALAMRGDQAASLGIESIEDLARHAPQLVIGSDYEFFKRPEWDSVRDKYGLEFGDVKEMDSALMYDALRDGSVDVITAFSTDGRIAAYEMTVLDDPRKAFPPYQAILLLSPQARQNQPLVEALRPLVGAIDAETMRWANMLVDAERLAPAGAAAQLADRVLGPTAAPEDEAFDEPEPDVIPIDESDGGADDTATGDAEPAPDEPADEPVDATAPRPGSTVEPSVEPGSESEAEPDREPAPTDVSTPAERDMDDPAYGAPESVAPAEPAAANGDAAEDSAPETFSVTAPATAPASSPAADEAAAPEE